MYLVFATVIVLIIYMFGSNIVKLIISNVENSSSTTKMGNIWFAVLLIVNISIIIFIFTFYYSKINDAGILGASGYKGKAGIDGEPCMITIPNSIFYAPYNGMA